MQTELREHQATGIEELRNALREGYRRPMLQAPTGAGKTVLAAAITEMALAKGRRVLFVVPSIDLVDQTVEAFCAEGLSTREQTLHGAPGQPHAIGVMQADHPWTDPNWWDRDAMRPIQVATVQTLAKRGLPPVDLAVVDEAHEHHKLCDHWFGVARYPIIGLSATPWAKGLGKPGRYDRLIVVATTQELIDKGFLCPFRVFAPVHPDLSRVEIGKDGDYKENQLSDCMRQETLVGDSLASWKRFGESRPTLAFCVDRAHAQTMFQKFKAAGVPSAYVDFLTDRAGRLDIKRGFADGSLKVVFNVGVLTKGVDWDVRCELIQRPTRSKILFTQIVGRALRTAESKADALLLDHSDNHLKLGFVTDIHQEHLDDGTKAGAALQLKVPPKPNQCPKCSMLRPMRTAACPGCGYVQVPRTRAHWVDGELRELSADRVEVEKERRKETIKSAKDETAVKRAWYGMLLGYCEERGYQPGWAWHKFNEKFGHWPSGYSRVPYTPTNEVRSWCKSRTIAFAKRREENPDAIRA